MYDYRDKLKGQDDRRSIFDILSLDSDSSHLYEAVDIDKVKIDGNTFNNYGAYQFIWEKTFVKSPQRSSNGSMGNLNSYATFLTPHLLLNFSIMSIDDYRAIMRMHYESNEFIVECYDPIYNTKIKAKMYFGTEEMAKLYTINRMRQNNESEWEDWIELVGVRDYTVDLIGTNNDIESISIIYHLNPPSGSGYSNITVGEEDIYSGEDVEIGKSATSITSETFGGLYKFKNWNISPNPSDVNKGVYINGKAYTINVANEDNALVLYAQWELTTSPASYSTRAIETNNIVNVPETYSIEDYSYHTLDLYVDGVLYQRTHLKYDSKLNLPILEKSFHTFDGWYYTYNYEYGTKFSGNMPSYDLILYARFIENV